MKGVLTDCSFSEDTVDIPFMNTVSFTFFFIPNRGLIDDLKRFSKDIKTLANSIHHMNRFQKITKN